MLRIFSTPKTSVSPSATMNSHDAYVTPSTTMVTNVLMKKGGVAALSRSMLRRLRALRALEAALDPVLALDPRRRVDALGREALDVDQRHHLLLLVVLGAADGGVLDRLVPVAERHADAAGRRFPFRALQRRGQLLRRGLLAAVRRHRLLRGKLEAEQRLHHAVGRLDRMHLVRVGIELPPPVVQRAL